MKIELFKNQKNINYLANFLQILQKIHKKIKKKKNFIYPKILQKFYKKNSAKVYF